MSVMSTFFTNLVVMFIKILLLGIISYYQDKFSFSVSRSNINWNLYLLIGDNEFVVIDL